MLNIILIGIMGCGKSTIGKMLADRLDRPFFDTDTVIETEQSRKIPQIFETVGEAAFRAMEAEVAKRFTVSQNAVVATGGGIVLNPQNIENLKRGGRIYFINRPLELILGDIETANRPLLKDGNDRLYTLYKQRFPIYKAAADIEIINDKPIGDILSEVLRLENISDKRT